MRKMRRRRKRRKEPGERNDCWKKERKKKREEEEKIVSSKPKYYTAGSRCQLDATAIRMRNHERFVKMRIATCMRMARAISPPVCFSVNSYFLSNVDRQTDRQTDRDGSFGTGPDEHSYSYSSYIPICTRVLYSYDILLGIDDKLNGSRAFIQRQKIT